MNSREFRPATQKQQNRWEILMRLGKKCGCHQLQSRSFFYKNFQFPICSRCTGILIGEFILAPISLIFKFNLLPLNLSLLGIMSIDGLLQYYNLFQSNNKRRLITGLMGGYAIMLLSIFIITMVWRLFFIH